MHCLGLGFDDLNSLGLGIQPGGCADQGPPN
jgi:hypothetical protein